jgi:glycosyltransferase involved in cell wall biosynthesis
MKVLMVTPYYYPIIGGTESFIESLSLGLNENGTQADVLTFNLKTNSRRFNEANDAVWKSSVEEINGLKVIKIPSHLSARPFWLFNMSFVPGSFLNYLKEYDVIHFHNETDLTFPIFSYFLKKPKIMHCHCLDVSYIYYRKNIVSRRIFQSIAGIYVAVSSPIRNLLIDLGLPKEKIRVVHNEVDTKKFKISKDPKDENQLLFVGRLQPKKGLHVLLKSLEYVTTPTKLAIVGPLSNQNPDYNDRIFESIKRINETSIHKAAYLGVQRVDQLVKWYQRATIFICPSLSEPFGIVNLESMACGTPVIATKTGGIPEAVQDNKTGILVQQNDPKELAEAIQSLLEDAKLRKRFGDDGRRCSKSIQIY